MNRGGLFAVLWSTALSTVVGLPLLATAQQIPTNTVDLIRDRPDRGVSVTERERPDYQPRGLRVGSFLFKPKLLVAAEYDDNVFADQNNTESDELLILSPSFTFNSDWVEHAIGISYSNETTRYRDLIAESTVDNRFQLSGRYDLTRAIEFIGALTYADLHEDRGSRDDVAGASPTELNEYGATIGANYDFNVLGLGVETGFKSIDFEDSVRNNPALQPINNDDRDRKEFTTRFRGTYQVIPRWRALAGLTLSNTEYDDRLDDAGFNRDNNGYRVDLGFEYEISGVTFIEVTAGYIHRRFDDRRFDDIDDLGLGIDLEWNITGLTTLRGFVDRSVETSTSVSGGAGSAGIIATSFGAAVEHELLRNLILLGRLSFTEDDFDGSPREDDIIDFSFSAEYLANPNLHLGAGYFYRDRDVSGVDGQQDFTRNRFRIWASTQF